MEERGQFFYMENARVEQQELELNDWTDLWFSEHKKAGYIGITKDFKKVFYYGENDVKQLVLDTKYQEDRFLTVNAFPVNPVTKKFTRNGIKVRQLRNVAIDIDQYNLGLTIDEALNEIKKLIESKQIPEPNLILTSRGIQLFYSIDKGASPKMAWLTRIITEQLVGKLKHIGADSQAVDVARFMRVPNTFNSRNNSFVKPQIWNNIPYSLKELQSYCVLLDKKRRAKSNKQAITFLTMRQKIIYKVNDARLNDLRKLIELREGNFPYMRNTLLYIYSYHQTLVLIELEDVMHSVKNTFSDVYSTAKSSKQLSNNQIEATIKSAHENAINFYYNLEENSYTFEPYSKESNGTIKPFNSDEIIEKLNITVEEQRLLSTIRSKEVKKEHEKERITKHRRKQGVKSREEYEREIQQENLQKINILAKLMEENPKANQRQLADMMGISPMTVSRFKKVIER